MSSNALRMASRPEKGHKRQIAAAEKTPLSDADLSKSAGSAKPRRKQCSTKNTPLWETFSPLQGAVAVDDRKRDAKNFLYVTSKERVLGMTLNLAKARRLEALDNRNVDRILVKPAAHHSQVKMPDEGTVADYLIEALRHGTDLGELASETGWSKSHCAGQPVYGSQKKPVLGFAVVKMYFRMVLPKGCEQDYIKS